MMLSRVRDHPRVCGEHSVVPLALESSAGSSPRMRGTLGVGVRRNVGNGIIPAYAGNTIVTFAQWTTARDHPRVCGEHGLAATARWGRTGSSPRMRGTLRQSIFFVPPHGIIPAYAGNTRHSQPWQSNLWDHPRVCGEHYGVSPFTPCALGSSPRMRGTLDVSMVAPLFSWIIPAYAGNTSLPHKRICRHRDHPRVCGEHKDELDKQTKKQGSSPRMRGTLDGKTYSCKKYGIIPAYAGNTLTWQ